jgi:DNA modification methylase
MHPTVKPVALCAEAIKDCTRRGEIVLDPFAGSGSTIIAAIKSGRIGYGIELDPKYCDVIVQRFEKLTGKSAVLEKTGLTFAQTKEIRRPERQHQSDDPTPVDCAEESPNVRIRFRKSLAPVVMGA